eukprot:CAMPEP_0178452112 /NCGR_PEP_ID=MMETSP0689_2-20121128/44061_1 /TAXON_ID=160604 /ORGANISM="Amphidinium massartii, Strain CS-259" /LENGTH=96 /DNA_ID=CAMNT_0020077777 /DNA_START=108 /DNA_END=395 /DNA_ORIENTATION=+
MELLNLHARSQIDPTNQSNLTNTSVNVSDDMVPVFLNGDACPTGDLDGEDIAVSVDTTMTLAGCTLRARGNNLNTVELNFSSQSPAAVTIDLLVPR